VNATTGSSDSTTAGPALVVAILGAESTGKTWLAQSLAQHLTERARLRATWVPETLRAWCDAQGRTPRAEEQQAIAQAHHAAIDEAAGHHDVVLCDTTAAMTATYSRLLFDDGSLDSYAAGVHRRVAVTLVTALDLPWVADGLQRDGPQVREPVDASLRAWLDAHRLAWHRVQGHGEARMQHALHLLQPALRNRWPALALS